MATRKVPSVNRTGSRRIASCSLWTFKTHHLPSYICSLANELSRLNESRAIFAGWALQLVRTVLLDALFVLFHTLISVIRALVNPPSSAQLDPFRISRAPRNFRCSPSPTKTSKARYGTRPQQHRRRPPVLATRASQRQTASV